MNRRVAAMYWLVSLVASQVSAVEVSGTATEVTGPESRWEYYQEVSLREDATSAYCDFLLDFSVFDGSRPDLGDLRLLDASGIEVPYALRVLRTESVERTFEAREFDRSKAPDESMELTLDIGNEVREHNLVEVATAGFGFRRRAELEGSNDRQQWRLLATKNLVHFPRLPGEKQDYYDRWISYPPSRFRYLRIRVHRDPVTDDKAVEIDQVKISYHVELQGETMRRPVQLGPYESKPVGAGPGSAWLIDLGTRHVPVQKLLLTIADSEFNRDYYVEIPSTGELGSEPELVAQGQWIRRPSEADSNSEAVLDERPVDRLRLLITDFRNPPLTITSVEIELPARQIVFAKSSELRGPLRLYYGNPEADPPHYDLERTLPARLESPPTRLKLDERQANPSYVPEPKPLTERWPWFIYVVLSTSSLVLAGVLINLGRTAIAQSEKK